MKFFLSMVLLMMVGIGHAQDFEGMMNKAKDLESQDKYDEVFSLYSKIKAAATEKENWDIVQRVLIRTAADRLYLGKPQEASDDLQQARKLQISKGSKQPKTVGDYHFFKGQYFLYYSYYSDSARYYFIQSLKIRELLTDPFQTAITLVMLGDVERYQFYDYVKAEGYYEQALPVLTRLNRKDYWLATVNYSLGTTYRLKGDLGKALSYCLEAAKIAEEINDEGFKETCVAVIGNIYNDQEQYELAIRYFQNALKLNERNNERLTERAIYYENIGSCDYAEKRFTSSLKNFDRSIAILKEAKESEGMTMATVLRKRASCLSQLGLYDQATKEFYHALAILKKRDQSGSRFSSELFKSMGEHFESHQKLDSALFYYHQGVMLAVRKKPDADLRSLPSQKEIGDQLYLFDLIFSKAQVLMKMFENSKGADIKTVSIAMNHYSLAESLLQRYRNSYDYESSKKRFTSGNHELYEGFTEAAFILFENKVAGADSLLMRALENSKANRLQESITDRSLTKSLALPDSIIDKQHSIASGKTLFNEKLNNELKSKKPDSLKVKYYQENLIALDRESLRLKAKLKSDYPGYYSISTFSIPSIKEIQEMAQQENGLVLDYFWGEKKVYVLAVSGISFSAVELSESDSIGKNIKAVLGNLINGEESVASVKRFKEFKMLSSKLYQDLVAPFLDQKFSRLLIIPDGDLYQLPFEILLTEPSSGEQTNYKSLPYLIQKVDVGYGYSFNSYLVETSEAIKNPSLLAFAYAGDDPENATQQNRESSNSLPGTERELQAIKDIIGSGDFYFQENASEDQFKRKAPNYDILHLALHGFTGENMLDTKLLFRPSESMEDDTLFTNEIYMIRLRATLTILSACETGVGKFDKGEGVSSVASAFAYAGCPRVVMSLWKVDDNSTAQLMSLFYQQLKVGDNVSQALTTAKKRYLSQSDEFTAHPSFWASFILMGNQKPVFQKNIFSLWYALGLLGAIAALTITILVVSKKRRRVV